MARPLRFAVVLLLLATCSRAAEPILKITAPGKTVTFTVEEFAALPHTAITVDDPYSHLPRHFTGVAVDDLLTRLDLPLGDKLRGLALQLVVVFRSPDNYGVAFALADFDRAFSDRTLLLADREDGKPLPEKAAPFQLIAPGDKKAARWARMVTSIEIVSLASKL